MSAARASTSKLAPGEDTIGRSTPRKQPDGTYWMDFSWRPTDGSAVRRPRIKGARTGGEARRAAREKLAELKATGGGGQWKLGSAMTDYIDRVVRPEIVKAGLAPLTLDRYEIAVRMLLGDCEEHAHTHRLKKHTVASGTRFRTLQAMLTEIAALHGRETARQTRTVLNKHLIANLLRDGLLTASPIAGVTLDQLTGTRAATERARGGRALSRAEYDAVLEHLLALDPAEDAVRPIRGRWTLADRVAKRRNVVDLALLQAASGLRSAEANLITWRHIGVDAQTGRMHIDVTREIAKGGIPRVALVLDQRVADRMRERQDRASKPTEYVIGAPSDAGTVWEARNRNKATAGLYVELADRLGIPALETERSHIWRTTLHALYDGTTPAAVLNSQFGHSEKTHQRHYTDASDLSALDEAARRF